MNEKIPEALAVLDLFISTYVDGQIPKSDQDVIRKARAAFAAEHEALKGSLEWHNSDSWRYGDNDQQNAWLRHRHECAIALAAVNKLS